MTFEEFKEKYNYESATSIIKQYLDIKYQNLDCIILFRLGDFYELFFEDAVIISKLLGLTLTKRSNKEDNVPMCGVPYHALANYLPKIVEEGFKVAICDQIETPEEAKKRGGTKAVIKRDVVRIATSGTMFEDGVVENAPNYLMSLVCNQETAAIAYVDITTLEFKTTCVPINCLLAEVTRIDPKEILVPQSVRPLLHQILTPYKSKLVSQVDSYFAVSKCTRSILEYYNIANISSLGQLRDLSVVSIGSVLQYLSLTQKSNLPQLGFPKILNNSKFMLIDAVTRSGLEISRNNKGMVKGSLFDALNSTITKSGARLFYSMLASPLTDIEEIKFRHDLIEFFKDNLNLCNQIRSILNQLGDPERSISRINMHRASPADLLDLKNAIVITNKIKEFFTSELGLIMPDLLEKAFYGLQGHDEIYNLIHEAIIETDLAEEVTYIKHSYHQKIQELCDLIKDSHKIVGQLRLKYVSSTGIENLKISQNNVLGMFVEVSSRNISKLDDTFIHRQTTVNGARFTTSELQNLEKDIINAQGLLRGLEKEIFTEICHSIMQEFISLNSMATSLNFLDVITSAALFAHEKNYCKPEMLEDNTFIIKDGRHPVVEDYLKSDQTSFIANDSDLSDGHNIWLLTGPNMSGKSTFLRQNAVIAIIAQAGFFVPASYAKIGIIDKVFSRIGASDDLAKGQSTFMVEMTETAAILAQATSKSLIIIDELGRGTSTYDGVSIALSCLEYIHDAIKCRSLFATHYHELASFSSNWPNIRNYHVSAKEVAGSLLFLHKIKEGPSDRSYGIKIAKLAGIPISVIRRAEQIFNSLQQDVKLTVPADEINYEDDNYQKIKDYICKLDANQITPRNALDEIFKLQELIK
ncbi:DNA mismatch repair protein MutS [Candidatus Phycorickettsia trachydisci]|uniref:DNA mismatch repair protein MutS n=1 Tax=Candidatus Phycorickettsia trachydisci TaxID=2115978 RepID=A0A2P1P7C8_9RICK|nr:DNA mismatch repair protein MutS [Candidatus Phycorickettsia trachydisci]AVP87174.1 DNA mismatch repair protein MutS [Candidatus Phycorickettsia trachydisci]